jgi:hypothetical protein
MFGEHKYGFYPTGNPGLSSLTFQNDPVYRSFGGVVNENVSTNHFVGTSSLLSGKADYDRSINEPESTSWVEYPSSQQHGKKDLSSLQLNQLRADVARPDIARPRPIQEMPLYVEKATSFMCTLPPEDIFEKVTSALDSHNVDYEYLPLKNKIKGICYPNNMQCTFHVHVFQSKTGEKLVEFQRRSGCVIAFAQFFSRLVADSLSSVLSSGKAPKQAQETVTDSSDVKLDELTVQSLFEMIQSCNIDVQRQGLQTLFNVAIDDANKKVLMQSPIQKISSNSSPSSRASVVTVFDVLKQLLSSKDEQVVHYAAMILQSFSSSECSGMCRQLISHPLLDSMFDILNSTWAQSLSLRAAKRTLAQTISTLSKMHAKELMGFPNSSKYVQTLERYSCCSDLSMRKFCSQSLDELSVDAPNPALFL